MGFIQLLPTKIMTNKFCFTNRTKFTIMRAVILAVFSLLVINGVFGQTQKTFVKSFTMGGDNGVVLNLEGDIEVKEWAEPFVRVHSNVMLDNASSQVLKTFLIQGRYNLKKSTQDGSLKITSAPRSANIKYRGQNLEETVTYTVFVPQFVEAKVIGEDGVEKTNHSSK